MRCAGSLVLILAIFGICEVALAEVRSYSTGQKVPFYVNKIGPYSNPSETYEFYQLPFCQPKTIQHKHASMGEGLAGDHKVNSLYDIRYLFPIKWTQLCEVHLSKEEVDEFKKAIDKKYYYEMFYDGLAMGAFVGTIGMENKEGSEVKHYYLFTHLHFSIYHNSKGQIIHVNVSVDYNQVTELTGGDANVEFSYSATWIQVNKSWKDRGKLGSEPMDKDIHWLSIMNSVVLVLLLTGFVAIVMMRILKSDFLRYARSEEDELDDEEDYGWKLLHADVFRVPKYNTLFFAFIGLGVQSVAIMFSILIMYLLGLLTASGNDGTTYVAAIMLYAFTSALGGYVSARYYKQFGGKHWTWNLILVATLYTIPLLIVFAFVNTVAIVYHSTVAVPFSTILIIVGLIAGIGFPLTLVGGFAGRRQAGEFTAPCRTNSVPREIPPGPIYCALPLQMMMAGFLPFSAIYIELYYIFASVWGHGTYQLFGILFLVAIILLIVTACITVALTYFKLSMEDHRWWWNSFLNGGSAGIFIFAYSWFYYQYQSRMTGMLQTCFYFSYSFLICYFFFIMLGTVGVFSSLLFVRTIYKKLD